MGIKSKIIRLLGGIPKEDLESERKLRVEEAKESQKSEDSGNEFKFREKSEGSIGYTSGNQILRYREKQGEGKSEGSSPMEIAMYEKIVKIEEISRILEEKLDIIEKMMATKEDSRRIVEILNKSNEKQGNIDEKLSEIKEMIANLRKLKAEFTGQLTETTRQLTQLTEAKAEIDKNIELLEAHKKILEALKLGPKSSIDLARELGYTRQYIWERLQELKTSGYVNSRKEGRKTVYFLVDPHTPGTQGNPRMTGNTREFM